MVVIIIQIDNKKHQHHHVAVHHNDNISHEVAKYDLNNDINISYDNNMKLKTSRSTVGDSCWLLSNNDSMLAFITTMNAFDYDYNIIINIYI